MSGTATATAIPAASAGPSDGDIKRQVLNRLRRAQGQLGAVIGAVEAEVDCRDIVTQLAAVSSAVQRAGFTIIVANMRGCLDADATTGKTPRHSMEDLEKMLRMLH